MNVTNTLFSMMTAPGGDGSPGQESEADSFASVFALFDTDSSVRSAEAGRAVREVGAIRLTSTEVQVANSVFGGENPRAGTPTGISLLHGDRTASPVVVIDTAELIWIGEVQPDRLSTQAVASTATRDNGNPPILLLELVTLLSETDGDFARSTAERLAKALESVLGNYIPAGDGPQGGTPQDAPTVVAVRVTSFETALESMVTEPLVSTPVISGLTSTTSDSEQSSRVVTPVAPLSDEPAVEGVETQSVESNHLRGSARQTNGRHDAPAPRNLGLTPLPPGVAPTLASAEDTNDRLNDHGVVTETEESGRSTAGSGVIKVESGLPSPGTRHNDVPAMIARSPDGGPINQESADHAQQASSRPASPTATPPMGQSFSDTAREPETVPADPAVAHGVARRPNLPPDQSALGVWNGDRGSRPNDESDTNLATRITQSSERPDSAATLREPADVPTTGRLLRHVDRWMEGMTGTRAASPNSDGGRRDSQGAPTAAEMFANEQTGVEMSEYDRARTLAAERQSTPGARITQVRSGQIGRAQGTEITSSSGTATGPFAAAVAAPTSEPAETTHPQPRATARQGDESPLATKPNVEVAQPSADTAEARSADHARATGHSATSSEGIDVPTGSASSASVSHAQPEARPPGAATGVSTMKASAPGAQADARELSPTIEGPRTEWVTLSVEAKEGGSGTTRIRVAVQGDRVNATILPADGGVVEYLRTHIHDLRQSLIQHGFSQSRLSVQPATSGGGAQSESHDPNQRTSRDNGRDSYDDSDGRRGSSRDRSRHDRER